MGVHEAVPPLLEHLLSMDLLQTELLRLSLQAKVLAISSEMIAALKLEALSSTQIKVENILPPKI